MNNSIAIVIILLTCQTLFVWYLSIRYRNPSIIDASWPIGLLLAGSVYLIDTPLTLYRLSILILLLTWSARLFSYIFLTRIRKGHVDKRYLELSENWTINRSIGFLFNYMLQAFFIFVMTCPFYFVSDEPTSYFNLIGFIIVVIGIVGESLADYQLMQFKKTIKTGVCNAGLWAHSRHPNYFFDFLTWCGFAIFGFNTEYGWLSILSPLLLYYIFNYVTGPLTEASSIKAKGHLYEAYQQVTPMFIPRLRRK